MVSKIKLLTCMLLVATVIVAGEPRKTDTVGHKETATAFGLNPHEGTSDLYTQENVIQATTPSVDTPDTDYDREQLAFDLGNTRGFVKIRWKPETFYAKNANLLNNNVKADQIFLSRSTLDVNFGFEYGKKCYGTDVLEFYMTLRSKAVWGNPAGSISSATEEVKLVDSLLGPHSHTLNRQFPWIREVWLRFSINQALNLSFENEQTFAMGSFPFQLGRGISLGSAYAVNSGVLGFFSDNTIDQYAYGYLFSGGIVKDVLSYDLYGAILEDFMDSFKATTLKIRGQELGRRLDQVRGSGRIDYVLAGRLRWVPIDNDETLASFEPYLMYNNNPEVKVEFIGDSSAKLGTFGCAGEFAVGNFEFGFDGAVNFGSQHIRGWDRNRVKFENAEGLIKEVNDRVVTSDPNTNPKASKYVFVPGSRNQKIIESEQIAQSQNGKSIPGTMIPDPNDPERMVPLFNDLNRFRDPYRNKLKGWMLVLDGAYTFCDYDLKLVVEGGVASGDEDPNKDLEDPNDSRVDGDFKGFIGLQEIYTGNRVKSVFLLGGAGRLPRPLSSPTSASVIDTTPSTTSNFTNLVYIGTGLDWKPCCKGRYFQVKPNLLGYWQQHRTKAFDLVNKRSFADKYARAYLGTEVNCFIDTQLLKDFSMFAVGSVFIPGAHYKDIKGKPLNAEQQKILDNLDLTGINIDTLPLLSDDIAWTINIGMEAKF